MSMDISSKIQESAGFDLQSYTALIESSKNNNIDTSKVDSALLQMLNEGVDFKSAVSQMQQDTPTLTAPKTSFSISSFTAAPALPSPLGMMAALMIDTAAEQRQYNRENMVAQGKTAIESMQNEADEIRSNATKQLALAITSSVITMASAGVQAGFTCKSISSASKIVVDAADSATKEANKIAEAASKSFANISDSVGRFGQGVSSTFQASASMVNSSSEATQKEYQKTAEEARLAKEMLSSYADSLKELINKTMDAYNAVQQNVNQTRSKILG